MTKTKKKWTALAAAAACLALVSLVGWLHSLPPAAYPIVEDYADGVRIQSSFGGDACYAVGTNSIGKPAFVDPEAALAQFQEDQKDSFAWLAAENDLPPIAGVDRLDLIPGGLGFLGGDGDLLPDQLIHQRGLSHIGAPDNGRKA